MKKITLILFLLIVLTKTSLLAQKDTYPDTIYCLGFATTVVFVNTEYWTSNVTLIECDFTFTKKKPDNVYLDIDDSGWIWSHNRDIVDGDDAYLVYSSDIISEKSIKERKGRIFAQLGNNYHIYYTKEKPSSKRFQRSMDRLLKKLSKREKTKS